MKQMSRMGVRGGAITLPRGQPILLQGGKSHFFCGGTSP